MPYSKDSGLSPESLARVQDYKARHETLYTIKEVAAITSKSVYSLRKYLQLGKMECTKIQGRIWFSEKQIEDFMMPKQKGDK